MPTCVNSDVTFVSFGFPLGLFTERWLSISPCLAGVSAGSWSTCPVQLCLLHFISLVHGFAVFFHRGLYLRTFLAILHLLFSLYSVF